MIKYIVKETEEEFEDITDVIDYCIDDDYHADDDIEDWINNRYDYIDIAGERYYAYDILDRMDPDVINDLCDDYCQEKNEEDRDEARWELERAEQDDEIEIQNYTVRVVYVNEEVSVESIEDVRRRLEQNKVADQIVVDETKKSEECVMKMLQTIGG